MKVIIGYHSEFQRQLKKLNKKYSSLKEDYRLFLESILLNPFQGDDLGNGVRKIRMMIKSKGKGKSGGARVITYNVQETKDEVVVTLLTIYDKSEMENISDSFIQSLIR